MSCRTLSAILGLAAWRADEVEVEVEVLVDREGANATVEVNTPAAAERNSVVDVENFIWEMEMSVLAREIMSLGSNTNNQYYL